MKKSLLFLFLLILGVTQGWAVVYETIPSGGGELKNGAIYRVTTTNRTALPALSVPGNNSTVTIYIEKGKTLFVRGTNGSTTTGATPAISVPENSTLIITGGGTLRVYGGKAGQRNGNNSRQGGGGAAPAIGGIGGNGGADRKDGGAGTAMGTVYVRGNVIVRAARGTSYGRRSTNSAGADGLVPTYAIGGGAGGGAGRNASNGSRYANGATGDNGSLYIEKSARVVYLNGRRDIRNRTVSKFTNPTKLNVQYIVDGTLKTTQELKEFGTLNVKNEAYSVTTEDETLNDYGFTTVTVKNVKSWNTKEDGSGDTYNPKDLLVYNNIDRTGASVDFPLYAQWDENSGVEFNGIHDAYELTQFANVVNGGKAAANGILLADIDMSRRAWNPDNKSRAKDKDGNIIKWDEWNEWVPIGAVSDQKLTDAGTIAYAGVFDGNGYVVSNITMSNPVVDVTDATDLTNKWDRAYARAGLIGYAKGATIKNVVVMNATIYGRWQVAAVCGRLDRDGDKGSLTNCGSYGTLTLECVDARLEYKDDRNRTQYYTVNDERNLALDARVVAGVVNTDYSGGTNTNPNPPYVSSVWSTYNGYNNTEPATGNLWIPRKNYVVATWNNTRNPYWSDYTQNSGTQNNARPKKTWVYVPSANSAWLSNGKLCLDLNGNVDGATTWTQTFVNADDSDPYSYNECPRPTNRGLAVYSGEPNYNRIYTISFESNGGTDCDDVYITRKYNVTDSYTYPQLPTTTRDGREFVGWFDSNAENATQVTSTNGISSDITLYAQWNQTMTISGNIDPKEKDYYYSTFYYSDQAFEIQTSNAYAYKAKRLGDGTTLKMESIKAAAGGKVVIPAGEAVIIRSETKDVELKAVDSEADFDGDNILYGSDEEVPVEDVIDQIPDADTDDKTYSNCYIFSGNITNGVGFYKPNSTALKPHKAFVLLDGQIDKNFSSTEAKSLSMLFDDDMDEEEATGISEYKSETETKKAIFSINGMPLSKLQKGINIVGGKKVFVK